MRELKKHPTEVPKGKDIYHFGFLSPQNSSEVFVLGVGSGRGYALDRRKAASPPASNEALKEGSKRVSRDPSTANQTLLPELSTGWGGGGWTGMSFPVAGPGGPKSTRVGGGP